MTAPNGSGGRRFAGSARATALAAGFAAAAVPALALLFLSFRAGGFFAGTTGLADVLGLVALVLLLQVARRPFAGVGPGALVAIGALTLLAVWALVSASWSDATARAVAEFDRYLLYALVVVLGAAVPWARGRFEASAGGIAAAIIIVGAAGVLTRLFPRALHVAPNVATDRLSFPLTYWNGLGILLASGLILCAGLTCSERAHRAVRALAAAAIPMLAVGLYLTLARGAIVALAVGLVAFLLLVRSRAVVFGTVAALPPAAVAVVVAYGQDALSSQNPTSLAAASQGRHLAVVLAGCMAAAALLRLGLEPIERALTGRQAPRLPGGRPAAIGVVVALLLVVIGAGLALGAPHAIRTGVHRFADSSSVPNDRSRLTSLGNNGRIEHWRVALEGFDSEPLHGTGAGTYASVWTRRRDSNFTVTHAHSAYLGVLSDLGIVGGLLLVVAVVALLAGLLRRAWPRGNVIAAGAFAAALSWSVHAGVDWDLELPATGIWMFALGGMALARSPVAVGEEVSRRRGPAGVLRLAGGVALLLLAVTPALMALSQPRIGTAIADLQRNACEPALDEALSATKVAGFRPEPFEVLGFCDVRLGNPRLGVTMMGRAVARDPDWWEYRYGLALVRGAAGLDPRAATAEAHRLNPLNEDVLRLRDRLRHVHGPAGWRRVALSSDLPR
jgi:hypothetical protein